MTLAQCRLGVRISGIVIMLHSSVAAAVATLFSKLFSYNDMCQRVLPRSHSLYVFFKNIIKLLKCNSVK